MLRATSCGVLVGGIVSFGCATITCFANPYILIAESLVDGTGQVRVDPRNKEIDLDILMYGKIPDLPEEATQVWLSSGSFVLSLADVDPNLMMEDESMVWTSNDVVIVLEHQNKRIPLLLVEEK